MVNCPLKDKQYNGNCEQCTSREYCMLSEIMERLQTLESVVARMELKRLIKNQSL